MPQQLSLCSIVLIISALALVVWWCTTHHHEKYHGESHSQWNTQRQNQEQDVGLWDIMCQNGTVPAKTCLDYPEVRSAKCLHECIDPSGQPSCQPWQILQRSCISSTNNCPPYRCETLGSSVNY